MEDGEEFVGWVFWVFWVASGGGLGRKYYSAEIGRMDVCDVVAQQDDLLDGVGEGRSPRVVFGGGRGG